MKEKCMQDKPTHPAKMSSRVFIGKNGYCAAMKGGYKAEYYAIKAVLPSLADIDDLVELINKTENNPALRNALIKDIVKLWQDNFALRQASGLVLLCVMWTKLSDAKTSDFGMLCGDVFLSLERLDLTNEPDVIKAILKNIR